MNNVETIAATPKATIYRMSPLGWVRTEEKDVVLSAGPWAQYQRALRVQGTEKGKRKARAHVFATQSVIVLDGWGHPEVPALPQNVGILAYADEENDRGFAAALGAHVAGTGAKVLVHSRNGQV